MENKEDRRGNRVEMPDRDPEEEDALIDKTPTGNMCLRCTGGQASRNR